VAKDLFEALATIVMVNEVPELGKLISQHISGDFREGFERCAVG
jgi:hypothetical protein